MTICAKNAGRINVWRTYEEAVAAVTSESKALRRMTISRSHAEAFAHRDCADTGVPNDARLTETGDARIIESGDYRVMES